LLPALPVLAALATGCGGGDEQDKPKPKVGRKQQAPVEQVGKAEVKAKDEPKTDTTAPKATTPAGTPGGVVEGKGVATLKGKVSFDGTPPSNSLEAAMKGQGDKDHCLKGPTGDPLWIVGPDKGVKGVVVWLRAPKGMSFKIPADQMARKDEVVMDQPFCLFEPHIVAINPMSWDADSKAHKPTGQTFKVANSAPIAHNTAYTPSNKLVNGGGKNEILKPKGELPVSVKPGSKAGDEEILSIGCNIHPWMSAKVLVFDHPYYAVTNEKGEYEIKNAPAGAEVVFTHWHESFGPNLRQHPKVEPVTLKEGENVKDLSIK
jgi:hypothetical protein